MLNWASFIPNISINPEPVLIRSFFHFREEKMNRKSIIYQVFYRGGFRTHSYFILNNEKFPIFYHPPFKYWCYKNKLFFGTYSSFSTWEVELFVTEDIVDTNLVTHAKGYGRLLKSLPRQSLFKWGTLFPKLSFYIPEKDLRIPYIIKEKKVNLLTWKDSYYDADELTASISYSIVKRFFCGEIATGFVLPDHLHILPHLLGIIILPNLWR